ncbi:MAG: hypothetical protein K6B64_05035 [Acholeplasmatales bacterium]|nr:hypothetical protein [Acholeplasmatales bacterium]
MKKGGLMWFVGLLAFVALFAAGLAWCLHWIPGIAGPLGTVKMVACIILTVIALVFGWMWLSSAKLNKKFKLVLQILFVIFAVLAIIGFLPL